MPARTLELVLGLWLFVSAFALPRSPAGFAVAWVTGVAVAAGALLGMSRRAGRFTNTALSAWLFASLLLVPARTPVGRWNDAVVAFALLALSLVPGTMYAPRRVRPARA